MNASEELWISRAVDRVASADDWRGLEAIAAGDPGVWRRLCRTLEAETLLGARLAALVPPAATAGDTAVVAALAEPLAGARRAHGPRARAGRVFFGRVAAACAVVATFWLGRASAPASADPAPPRAATVAAADAGQQVDALLAQYLDAGARSGRVLDMLPTQTIASRKVAGSEGVEVVYVRSFVERRQVDRAVTFAVDEHGEPVPMQLDLTHWSPPRDF